MSDKSDEIAAQSDALSQTHLYQALALGVVALIASGTAVFRWLEDWSWVDSFYFCVVTVTTVGYGDFSPATTAGKLVAVVYIVIGVGIVATFLDARVKRAAGRRVSGHHSSDA